MTDSNPDSQSVMDREKSPRSHGGSEDSEETRSNDLEKTFEPLNGANGTDRSRELTVQRTHSHAERPLERSWSINDGYSFHGAEEAEREDEEAAKDASPAPDDEFTVGWEENDPMNPRNLSTARRWFIVVITSMGSVCVTCTSSMYTMTYGQLTKEFHCSRLVATLGLSFFIFGLGVGPLFLGPLSEFYGRRIIYIVSFSFFLIWLIPCAVAQNIQTMIVSRFFSGLSGSAFLSVAGGTVGDLFARHELAAPMMFYTASPFVGPELGPLLGGFINDFTTWRWTFYLLLIWTGAILVSIVLFVQETYHPVLLRRKAAKLRKETGDDRWKAPIEKLNRSVLQTVLRSIYRPMLLLTLEPMCLSLCIFSAILLGILYLFFGAFDLVFSNVFGFNLWQVGLSFIGIFVGMIAAILTDPLWRKNYARLERKHIQAVGEKGGFEPEWRLPPAIAGAPFVTVGLFIFAWTIYPNVHWIGPIIGSALFGAGTILVYSGIFTFLVDAYPTYAASALAANSFARSSFGAVFPLFGIQMYNRLGYHWASSLLAFLTVLMAPFPYIFFKYGKRIRKKSRFASSGHT
ncbi:hypothetical protein VTN02DRAFT_6339 [Thermoascus thermophilus]